MDKPKDTSEKTHQAATTHPAATSDKTHPNATSDKTHPTATSDKAAPALPKEVNQIEVKSFSEDDIQLVKKPLPAIADGFSLVKVHAAPINPLDLLRINGKVPTTKVPFTPGSECSGVVIESKGPNGAHLIGKKVATGSQDGCFKDYVVVPSSLLLVLDDKADLDSAACTTINPFTSYGLVDTAEKHGAKALINTAANSAVGKMVLKLCQKKGIHTINLVRSKERVEELKKLGAEHVLDTSDPYFQTSLLEKASSLHATVAFDCIAGDLAGLLIKAIGYGGILINYGTLSGANMSQIDSDDLILGGKTITTFVLFSWMEGLTMDERKASAEFVKSHLDTLFKPDIATKVPITTFKEALKMYKSNMSGGKILIIP